MEFEATERTELISNGIYYDYIVAHLLRELRRSINRATPTRPLSRFCRSLSLCRNFRFGWFFCFCFDLGLGC